MLETPSPHDKAAMTDEIHALWAKGAIVVTYDPDAPHVPPPSRPARDGRVNLVEPGKAPRLGKGGSPESRVAILHSLAHIESWAIDLSWDIIARFGQVRAMPRAFFDDFVLVAADEARHFRMLAARLVELGSEYGALNAHDGLWDSATETADSLEARLVIEHVVQNPTGHDYGHHMSKSAANMGGVLLAQELAPKGVSVQMLHPGFNKTGMTKKYEKIWEIEGAVDAGMGAKRVLHEVKLMSPDYNGLFINCEDGLQIPW